MKPFYRSIFATLLLAMVFVAAGCNKEEEPNNNPDTTSGATHESSDNALIGTWEMQLDKSYSQITEYDDKKVVDAVSGATSGGEEGGDTPQGGVVTYMNQAYSSASLGFTSNGTVVSTYAPINSTSTTTTTSTYTQFGNTITMDDKKYYIVEVNANTLILENYRIFMAKGKDVYCEFLHLVYHK